MSARQPGGDAGHARPPQRADAAKCGLHTSRYRVYTSEDVAGFELGRGKPLEEILASMNQVAEGVRTTAAVMKLAAEWGVEMPIVREVDAVLNHRQPVEETYRGLLRVTPGHEMYGEAW